MKNPILSIVKFITYDIWHKKGTNLKGIPKIAINEMKLMIITISNYDRHQIPVRSAALTFYTLMSIVPLLAMVLGISKGFNVDDKLVEYLGEYLGPYKEVINQISVFANAFLENSKANLFAGLSVIVLIWSVLMVFDNIEGAFNHIWEIKNRRAISRKVSDYLAVITFVPILLIFSKSIIGFVEEAINNLVGSSDFLIDVYQIVIKMFSVFALWMVFALIYMILPNTKVKFGAAFHAAAITGSCYLIIEKAYLYFQTSLSNYSMVYGGFAALPLFLIWVSISWQAILFGAELSFAYQNLAKYEYERATPDMSIRFKQKLSIIIVSYIAQSFTNQGSPLEAEELSQRINIPINLVRDILYDLEAAKIIYKVDNKESERKNYYTIAKDLSKLTIFDVLEALDSRGTGTLESIEGIEKTDKILTNIFNSAMLCKENILIKDFKV